MSNHDSEIRARLLRLLDRKQMPRRLEGKPLAIEDEMRALLQAISRNAPRSLERIADWWRLLEATLGETTTGVLWPTEREIFDAAKQATEKLAANSAPTTVAGGGHKTGLQIAAARMARGEAVGEDWLFGHRASALIREGGVREQIMREYRRGAYLKRKSVYGEASALAWVAEVKLRHSDVNLL